MDPDVVGSIELLTLVGIEENFVFAVCVDLPHLILFIGTCNQLAIWGKEHSIAATCRLQELRDLSIKVDLQDPIVRLIGKEDIPLRIDGRPFRKLAIIDDQLGLGALGSDRVLRPSGR